MTETERGSYVLTYYTSLSLQTEHPERLTTFLIITPTCPMPIIPGAGAHGLL